MARDFTAVSSDKLSVNVAVRTAYPLSLSIWFNSDDVTGTYALMDIADTAVDDDDWLLLIQGGVAGDPVDFNTRQLGTSDAARTTTGYTAGTWFHALGTGASSTSRACYLNGGGKGTATTDLTPASLDRTAIGIRSRAGDSLRLAGLAAECAIYSVALSDAEALMLANGLHPYSIQAGNLAGYWPVYGHASPEVDWSGGGNNMTVAGTTVADHVYTAPPLRQAVGWRGALTAAAANPAYQPWYHRAPVLAQ